MKQLHKLIFINSANIPYGDIALDGNVHFIGNQGVGKSTILRAILFFYNANTQKLGIPKGKKTFVEYYFEYPNTHLIYEVKTTNTTYCVWVFKSQNQIAYRFIDSRYDKVYFFDGRQALTEKGVRKKLNELEISHSTRKIERYEHYRDIIYGNSQRVLRKYALFESQVYGNIPRTISNIFLNSKLEGTFIKNTIINSIITDKKQLEIDLDGLKKHIASFQKTYDEITIFKKHQAKGEKIVTVYHQILDSEKMLQKTAERLGSVVEDTKQDIKDLGKKLKKEQNDKEELNKKYQNAKNVYSKNYSDYNEKIILEKNNLRKVTQLIRKYEEKDIETVLKLNAEKSATDIQLEQQEANLKQLTNKHQKIEDIYEQLFKQLDQTRKAYQIDSQSKENELISQLNQQKEKLREEEDQTLVTSQKHFDQLIDAAQQALNNAKEKEYSERSELKIIKGKTFLKRELEEVLSTMMQLKNDKQQLELKLVNQKHGLETYKIKAERAVELQKQKLENKQDKIQNDLQNKQQDWKDTQKNIDSYGNTIYGFLDSKVGDWRKNIGKVFKSSLLERTDLEPVFDKASDSFFGLKVNLEAIEDSAKTFKDFRAKARQLEQEIKDLKKQLSDLNTEKIDKEKKMEQKHNKEINKQVKTIQKRKQEKTQKGQHIKRLELEKEDIIKKAAQTKKIAIEEQNERWKVVRSEVSKKKKALEGIKQKSHLKRVTIKQHFSDKMKNCENEHQLQMASVQQFLNKQLQKLEKEGQDLEKERKKALQQEGANIHRIETIRMSIKKLKNKLKKIEKNQRFITEYQKDKREFIDKKADFEHTLKINEQQLGIITKNFEEQEQQFLNQLANKKNKINTIDREKSNLENDVSDFERKFKAMPFYATIETWVNNPLPHKKVAMQISELTSNCIGINDKIKEHQDKLKKAIDGFVRFFNPSNRFNFTTYFKHDREYRAFAEQLEDIFNKSFITELEAETITQFAMLVNSIAQQTQDLRAIRNKIDRVIQKINVDLRKDNFIDAVQEITLRTNDSNNKVVEHLLAIQIFHEEKPMQGLGGLFRDHDQKNQSKQAITLLKDLVKEMDKTKERAIGLEDTFRLQFKIVENNNSTNWVENLSNVGSNGTDVLVKAIVYITLLNVFKNKASNKATDFRVHCIIDEVGVLHHSNLESLVNFANHRNILLINGSPNTTDVFVYKHIYKLLKNSKRETKIKLIMTNNC